MRSALAIALSTMVWFSAQGVARAQCGAVPYEGCCVDDTNQKYCSSGTIKTKVCSGATPTCGWDATKKYYTCTTNTDADPAGTFPRLCSALPDGGPTPVKEAGVGCGAITGKGCCDATDLAKYCSSGLLKSKTCTGTTPKCGWDTGKNYYTCVASTMPDSDPAGTNPRNCSDLKPGDGSVTTADKSTTSVDKPSGTQGDQYVPPVKQDKGGTTKPSDDSGCSCAVGSSAQPLSLLLLLGAALLGLAIRRRG